MKVQGKRFRLLKSVPFVAQSYRVLPELSDLEFVYAQYSGIMAECALLPPSVLEEEAEANEGDSGEST